MNNNERVFIIIDGNNFYHRLKETFSLEAKLLNFHYQDFADWLAHGRKIIKKKIEYIGFSHKPSYGLITHSDIRRLLTKEDIEHFFYEFL
jgi:hypothetical protein